MHSRSRSARAARLSRRLTVGAACVLCITVAPAYAGGSYGVVVETTERVVVETTERNRPAPRPLFRGVPHSQTHVSEPRITQQPTVPLQPVQHELVGWWSRDATAHWQQLWAWLLGR